VRLLGLRAPSGNKLMSLGREMVAAPEVVAVKAQPRGPLWYGEAILDLG
jgi:hypothetical protein